MGQSDPGSDAPRRQEHAPAEVTRRVVPDAEGVPANRAWWDAEADDYQREHGAFLGDADFVWGPEGLRESHAGLLGRTEDLAGATVLEVGCGAAQCARWLTGLGARVLGVDLSLAQLQHSRRLDQRTGKVVPVAVADARRLPLGDSTVAAAYSAYGALPFVADVTMVLREVSRILRPGGRFVASVPHPLRWCLPDDPGDDGLVVRQSYFDRLPYVEEDETGRASYVEHHRTMGDWIRAFGAAGLHVTDLVEPEWPADLTEVWGGWSPLRGRLIPGTAIFVCLSP